MSKKIRNLFLLTLLATLFIVCYIGYQSRDNKFYDSLIKENQLKNSIDVYNWLTTSYSMAKFPDDIVVGYVSTRFLLENRKKLWCDEGAIAMATLDDRLGYKTRLIDLYGYDNTSHHTVMQAFEDGNWVTYDFSYHLRNVPFSKCTSIYQYKVKEPKVKPYPRLYNRIVNNNYFAKMLIFKIRGIHEK